MKLSKCVRKVMENGKVKEGSLFFEFRKALRYTAECRDSKAPVGLLVGAPVVEGGGFEVAGIG